jgi:hypothetical protein
MRLITRYLALVKCCLYASLVLVSTLSFAATPVTINSASINYTANTITITGQGFCAGGTLPGVFFNKVPLTVSTSPCINTSVVATLPIQAQGSFSLTVSNGSAGSATFVVTYGAVGPQGPQGFTGATGAKGATGATGAAGATGPQGPKGATGTPGVKGLTGAQGPIGLTGAVGPGGPAGQAGATGLTGATGSQGPIGLTGAQGATGPAGTNGTGFNFRNAFDPTATYTMNDVVTYGGSTYVANAGNGPNSLTPDANTSTWVVMAAAGAAGATGADGAQGPQGPIGLSVTGPQGPQGLTGPTGPQGSIGPQGPVGNTGATGSQGFQGLTGPQGIQGIPGPQGTLSMSSGTWNYVASVPTTASYGHYGGVGGVLNGQFLITNSAQANDTESYNPTTNKWTVLAPSPTLQFSAVGGVMNGQFYMVGGCSPADCRIDVTGVMQIYNPTTNSWSYGPSMPTARFDAASTVINGKLYVVGGDTDCEPCINVATLEVFDPVANAWATKAAMPNVLMGARGAAVGGKLYVVGGVNGLSYYNEYTVTFASHVSIYDPVSNTWTQSASSIPIPVYDSSAVAMDGLVYVIGGVGIGQTQVTAVQVYNPVADTWTSLTPLDTARGAAAASVISGIIYLAGGVEPGSIYPTTAESFFQYPQGPQGPQGPIGPTGATGPQGPQGLQGAIGFTGATGPAGPSGPPGAQGSPGINGLPGANGTNGTNGTNGLDGKSFVWRGAFDINISTSNGYAVNDVVNDGGSAYICTDTTPLVQGQTPANQPHSWSLMLQGMGSAYIKSRLSYQGAIPDITRTNLYPPVNVLELPTGTFLISARVTVVSSSTDPNVVACRLQANPYNPNNPPNDWSYVSVGPGVSTGFGGSTATFATIMTAQEVQIGPTESQLICYAFDPAPGSSGLAGDVQVESTVMTAIPTGGFVVQ